MQFHYQIHQKLRLLQPKIGLQNFKSNFYVLILKLHLSASQNYIIKMSVSINESNNKIEPIFNQLGFQDQKKSTLIRNIGCWSQFQQKRYIQFLSFSRKQLQSRSQRKLSKVFKHMASFIGTRDGIQCRSHHVKQLRTHRQISKIIQKFNGTKSVLPQNSKIFNFPTNLSYENGSKQITCLIEKHEQVSKSINQKEEFHEQLIFSQNYLNICNNQYGVDFETQPYFIFFVPNQAILWSFQNFGLETLY